jgi:hypothetical protein
MKKSIALWVLSLLVLFPISVFAAEFLAPEQGRGNVTISPGQEVRNLYTAAGNISIDTAIAGDLFAAGGAVSINGSIEEDLNAAGGTIVVNSPVGDDARLAGGTVTVSAPVAGDLLVAGGNVVISSASSIGRDLAVAGGNISVDAPVGGRAWISGDTIRINSRIEGELRVNASTSLTFGPNADVLGRIVHRGPAEANIEEGAVVSEIEYERVDRAARDFRRIFGGATLVQILSLFIAGWLLFRFAGRYVKEVSENISLNPLANVGIGVLFLLIAPVVIFLLFLSIIGYYLALLLFFFYILALLMSVLFAAIFVGSLLFQWFRKTQALEMSTVSILVGTLVLVLLWWIPVIGWLVFVILMLMGLGSFVSVFIRPFRRTVEPPAKEVLPKNEQ